MAFVQIILLKLKKDVKVKYRPFLLYFTITLLGVFLAIPGLEDIPFTQQDEITYFSTALSNQVLVHWILNNSLQIIGDSLNTRNSSIIIY